MFYIDQKIDNLKVNTNPAKRRWQAPDRLMLWRRKNMVGRTRQNRVSFSSRKGEEKMKKRLLILSALVLLLAVLLVAVPVAASGANFTAHLSGDKEVPPVSTLAQGQAMFQLSKDGTELSYRLISANIEDVLMAHIHLAPAGLNGSIVAWLYPNAPPPVLIPGIFNGVLAEGSVSAADLVGSLAGHPLSDLVDAMNAGNTYVNIHTSAHPGGEIRGQIH